jgi:hypothetical protein
MVDFYGGINHIYREELKRRKEHQANYNLQLDWMELAIAGHTDWETAGKMINRIKAYA